MYRVLFCSRVEKQKMLFTSCVSSLGLGSNSGTARWALGWISVAAVLVILFLSYSYSYVLQMPARE